MEAPPPRRAPQKETIAILGAGVTGLQSALSILSSPSLSPKPHVIVIAQHLPGDENIEYTSPWAGGHWRSHAHSSPEEAEIRDWDARTYREWRRLLEAAGGDEAGMGTAAPKSEAEGLGEGKAEGRTKEGLEKLEKHLGLGIRESVMYWSEETDETSHPDGSGLWWRDVVAGFRVLSKEELANVSRASGTKEGEGQAETKILFGVRYDTICINVPRYLSYLTERITALGGELTRATARTDGGLEGVVEDVQRIVAARSPGGQEVEALVVATGLLSARFLPPSEASLLYPVRGQTVLVKGEAPRAVTHLFPGGDIGYVIPRPGSGTTILGGCKEKGNWEEGEDKGVTERILRRTRGLVPELLVGRDGKGEGEFEALGVQVGRRPGRKGGPRVEVEKERVKGVRVVYAYGHEGAGYQNSVGSAEKVVRLLAEG
jgi:D-amino-acid oxidase